ncbi:PWWP domain-containing protein 3-like isoform X2 [Andrographis paniculata]|uniref:PWWP domain-containing protein 3-like isoform X2 n=1 Tax=Andrographis paniculata TaxID=175694 RepID=UPI0021E890CD|nr:PWWP domain-containing protein 3-like isoform X2 [Andrographis paniculata]
MDEGAATENISKDTDTKMGGSGSKSEVNLIRVSGLGETGDDGGESVAEDETGVRSANDCDNDKEKEKKTAMKDVGICSGYANGSSSVTDAEEGEGVNGVVENDGKGKDGETSFADNEGADSTNLNGGGRDSDVDDDGNGERDGAAPEDDQDQEDNQFCVGDLVWAKIRSHPWWPGQVYDPEDASEFSLKSKQKGRLLVAFFGDGSWSWCLPSQLVPFVENFAGMSRKSNSRGFLNAVQSAIDEVGRLVESEMSCKCVAKEKKDGLARPMVENAGVKAGVLVPEVASNRLTIPKYESKEIHGKVRQFARTVVVGNPVDLAVLKSCLSTFYYLKGGYQLTSYQEPLSVEGLEDLDDDVDEVSKDFNVPVAVPIVGPKDDDWHSSPSAGTVNSPNASGNKVFHKRKRKSVAELMGDNKNAVEKPASSRKRKKSNNERGDEASNLGASSTRNMGKKKKVEDNESPKITDKRVLDVEKNGANKAPSSRKAKNVIVPNIKIPLEESKEESEIVSTPRERKKSKYLSPPYTSPTWRVGNLSFRTGLQVEHDKKTQTEGETAQPIEEQSTPDSVSESADEAPVEKQPNVQLESSNISSDAKRRTIKDDQNVSSSVSDVCSSVSQLLLKTRLAAVDPFYLSQEGSLDTVWAFIYALRSSMYLHGPNYKIYRKCQSRGKRKSGISQLGNGSTQKKVNPPDQNAAHQSKTKELSDISKSKKPTEEPSDASKSKKPAETCAAKSNTKKVHSETLPCFIMEFAPDFPLPSKEDIVKLFGKFGSLRRKDVEILTETHAVHMFYKKQSDAEVAFKSSMSECPFGFGNVTCRLLQPSTRSKSGRKRARDNQVDDLISDACVIKQKAEMMKTLLENHQSKLSLEDSSDLKEEMKYVVEKLEAISDKVRSIC